MFLIWQEDRGLNFIFSDFHEDAFFLLAYLLLTNAQEIATLEAIEK